MVFRQSTYEAHKHKKSFDSKLPHIGAFSALLSLPKLAVNPERLIYCSGSHPAVSGAVQVFRNVPGNNAPNQQNYVYIFLVTILPHMEKRESAITSLFVISTPHLSFFIWFTFMNGGAGSIFLPLRLTAKNRYSNNLRNMLT
jgi:hypothetical protein